MPRIGIKMSDSERMMGRVRRTANKARRMGRKLGKRAMVEGPKISQQLKKDTLRALGDAIKATRDLADSPANRLDLIKKLYELKTAGIISEREFQAKKKQILDKI